MRHGRWLLATADVAEYILESVYQEWARAIIGSPPWRSADVERGELGWHLSGFARTVVDVAARQACLWLLSGTDLYRSIFLLAGCGAANS